MLVLYRRTYLQQGSTIGCGGRDDIVLWTRERRLWGENGLNLVIRKFVDAPIIFLRQVSGIALRGMGM